MKHYEFDINTGQIYQTLSNSGFNNYPRNLFEEIEENLCSILLNYKKVTFEWNGDDQYFIRKMNKQDDLIENRYKDNHPSYTEYFIGISEDEKGYNLYSYKESCILSYKDSYDHSFFDFFFALKLLTVDIMKMKDFFNYHLELSFDNNKDNYKDFLQDLLTKYGHILKNGKIEIVLNNYILGGLTTADNNIGQNIPPNSSIIQWTNPDNKNDFVKIIYALHEAKLINDGEGEITKIVEYLGNVFNVGLASSWKTNLAKSINNQNSDYNQKKIFELLGDVYLNYAQIRNEKLKKRTKS